MHRHCHLGEVFANVIPEDIPQADGAVGGAGRGQTRSTLTQDSALFDRT